MSVTMSIEEVSGHLSDILASFSSGTTEIILSRFGAPVARILPILHSEAALLPRVPGSAKGQITITDDFDSPLPDEIVNLFYDGAIEP